MRRDWRIQPLGAGWFGSRPGRWCGFRVCRGEREVVAAMNAMVLTETGPIDASPLQLCDLPVPEPGEIRVPVEACGICRTDLHVIEGELPPQAPQIVPGHQVVGVVDQAGLGTRPLKAGDRVDIAWLRSTCGQCRYCRAGKENLCPDARFTGYHEDGGYAEYAVVREDFAYATPRRSARPRRRRCCAPGSSVTVRCGGPRYARVVGWGCTGSGPPHTSRSRSPATGAAPST